MATFGELKDFVLAEAGCSGPLGHFKFKKISAKHEEFWDEMNEIEFKGYVPGEYEKEGTPALHEMDLLTQEEFDDWVKRFKEIHKKYNLFYLLYLK